MIIVGRKEEKQILTDISQSKRPEFLIVYGRRRVGKTYLIKEFFNHDFSFYSSGILNANMDNQLKAFNNSLIEYGSTETKKTKNWFEAFNRLKHLIEDTDKKDLVTGKKIIFLDEVPWMDTKKSDFKSALDYFWNTYASSNPDILLIVCGSATSWIIDNVIHNKGGLHNRITNSIHLTQFSLSEVSEYLHSRNIQYTKKQIIELYMILGGVPYYLSLLEKDLSFASNIDKLFVGSNAPLKKENEYLYRALFESPEKYISIIKALANGSRAGMTRTDLIKESGQIDNGNFSRKIDELEECGFIRKYKPFGKITKNCLIQLMDNFTLFYYKFLESSPTDENFFSSIINTPEWFSWSGLAFERVCLEHIKQIKKELQIGGVKTDVCSFYTKRDEESGIYGSQIDLLMVRKDDTINLCEMKFSNKSYLVTNKDIERMEIKRSDLKVVTKTKYSIIPTLIVSPNVTRNAYSDEFNSIIESDALFKQ